jgi:glucan phosphoethanolaminetransferase (alkaline phosphatase superfamily)
MKNQTQSSVVEKIGIILFYAIFCVSYFLIWNLLIRFPEDITARLISLLLCPCIVSILVLMIYTKEKRTLEHNSWKRMVREGRII